MPIPIPVKRYKYRFYFYERTNPNIRYLDETHAVNVYDGTSAGMTGRIDFNGETGFPLNTYMTPYFLTNTDILPIGQTLNFMVKVGTTVVLDSPVTVTGNQYHDIFIGGATVHEGDRYGFAAIKASDGTTRAKQMGRISNLHWYTDNLRNGKIIEGEPEESGFPYGDGGESETGDSGDASMTDDSTPIGVDDVRTLFLGQLFRVYKLNTTQLSSLSNFLLSADFLDSIAKLFSDPMDYLISLTAMPTNAFTGTSELLKIGNVTAPDVSGVRLSNFFVDIPCGSVSVPKYFGTFMDYSPYTSISLWLVGVGTVPLNPDAFIGQSVHVMYRLDAITGQALVFVSNDEGLIATYTANLAYHIPLRSKDYSEFFSGAMATTVGAFSGNTGDAMAGLMQTAEGVFKPHIMQSGALGGNTTVLANKKPYLIIERPSITLPANFRNTVGFKSGVYKKLGDLSGYTEVEAIHLEHVTATDEEKIELEALLKSGVIL